jgi:predicted DsbA family dithiol-disulfide isomerase
MTKRITIDFVSDVSCPWCAIGLAGLEQALANAADELDAEIRFHPYELNPRMPAGGQNIVEHVAQKYGSTLEESEANRTLLKTRAAEAGFDMAMTADSRIYNTIDAHRLLHWAALQGRQKALKAALFRSNFTENRDISDHAVLAAAAHAAGLDVSKARDVLASDQYHDEVREVVEHWRANGITSVPSIIFNGLYLVSGGLPAKEFAKILRKVAAEI